MRRNIVLEARKNEHECEKEQGKGKGKEVESVDSPACTPREANLSSDEGANTDVFNFSIEDFPVLPGSKPITIKVHQLEAPEPEQVKEMSVSLDSLEFDNKHSSSRSQSLTEAGKQSDSDVSAILDLVVDPTTVAVLEDQESSKSEEKMYEFLMPLNFSCLCTLNLLSLTFVCMSMRWERK